LYKKRRNLHQPSQIYPRHALEIQARRCQTGQDSNAYQVPTRH
jgi:hypothetical protein